MNAENTLLYHLLKEITSKNHDFFSFRKQNHTSIAMEKSKNYVIKVALER